MPLPNCGIGETSARDDRKHVDSDKIPEPTLSLIAALIREERIKCGAQSYPASEPETPHPAALEVGFQGFSAEHWRTPLDPADTPPWLDEAIIAEPPAEAVARLANGAGRVH